MQCSGIYVPVFSEMSTELAAVSPSVEKKEEPVAAPAKEDVKLVVEDASAETAYVFRVFTSLCAFSIEFLELGQRQRAEPWLSPSLFCVVLWCGCVCRGLLSAEAYDSDEVIMQSFDSFSLGSKGKVNFSEVRPGPLFVHCFALAACWFFASVAVCVRTVCVCSVCVCR